MKREDVAELANASVINPRDQGSNHGMNKIFSGVAA
jgi:hypothetical protein